MLAVSTSPIHVGAVYFEDNAPNDTTRVLNGQTVSSGLFEVSFSGGESGTQLTTLTIDTRQVADFNTNGTLGDVLKYVENVSANGITITNATLAQPNANTDGNGTVLTLTLSGFTAGETLVFSMNVNGAGGDPRVNGNEFSTHESETGAVILGSQFTATFTSDYTNTITTNSLDFFDAFDANFQASGADGLPLPNDNYNNAQAQATTPVGAVADALDTAGACGCVTQTLKPVSVSGKVVYSPDADVTDTGSETGISGVTLTLWKWNATTSAWQQVTENGNAVTTTTGGDGSYSFTDLDPGSYQVRMDQSQSVLSTYTDLATLPGAGSSSNTANVISTATLQGGQTLRPLHAAEGETGVGFALPALAIG